MDEKKRGEYARTDRKDRDVLGVAILLGRAAPLRKHPPATPPQTGSHTPVKSRPGKSAVQICREAEKGQ